MASIAPSSTEIKDLAADLPPETLAEYEIIKDELGKLKEECNEFTFLTAGKTGVGKSTLLNALTGSKDFKSASSRGEAGTEMITKYQYVINGVNITVWDSPGFEDSSGKDVIYKDKMVTNCFDVDIILYCLSLEETRATLKDHSGAITKITEALSKEAWKKAVIVLTRANKLESNLKTENRGKIEDLFSETVENWRIEVQKALKEVGVDDEVARNIPVVPAGHVRRKHLPGIQYWLSNLWLTIYSTVNTVHSQLALQTATEGRFAGESSSSSNTAIIIASDYIKMMHERRRRYAKKGAVIGALALGIPTMGIGAIVGAGVGGAVGGAAAIVMEIRSLRRSGSVINDDSVSTSFASSSS